jgi:hypothetical protein
MKTDDLLVLGIAGVAVFMILKAGGVALPTIGGIRHGLRYTPSAGYGDTSRYADYADDAVRNGGWGIE